MVNSFPTLYQNVISEEERTLLKNNALDLLHTGVLKENRSGKNRFFVSYKDTCELTKTHAEIYRRIVKILNLDNPIIDPLLGIIISVIKPGGFIHPHTDAYEHNNFAHLKEKRNIRFNIMVNRGDDVSYNPHISDKPFYVNVCDGWSFSASEFFHKTPIIVGEEFRIVYQFGFCVGS